MGSSGSIWVSLGLKTENFTKGIRSARGQLTGFQKGMAGLKGMFNPFTIGVAAIAGVGAAITNAVQIFKTFEKANSDLAAVLRGTDAEMKSLSDQAKALGASTAFTATEVAQLQKEFAKLGFDASQIENMTEATLNLAAAAGSELSEAASLAGATINAFGLNSQDAAHVTDVMALSFSKSALDMEKFSETMKNAAPIAKATGVSLETATAAAGKLADANITGSKAGTDLKRIFSELVKDGKPFADSLEDIAGQLNGAGTKAEKLAIAEELVGERAKGALLILADQKDELFKLDAALVGVDDAAQKMADTMLNNLGGSMTKAGSAYEGFILSLEDGSGVISKALKHIVDGVTELLGSFTKLAESKSLSGFFQRFAAISNPALAAVLDLKDASTEVKTSLSTVAEVMPDIESKTNQATTSVVKLTSAQKKEAEEIRKLKKEFGDLGRVQSKSAVGLKLSATSTDDITAKISRLTTELNKLDINSAAFATMEQKIAELQLSLDGKQLHIGIQPKLEPIPEEETEKLRMQGEQMKADAAVIGGAVSNAFASMADGMVANMNFADNAMGRFQKSLAGTVIELIATNMAAAMSNAITGATSSGSATGPAAVVTTPTFIASAIAGIIGAFAAIPAFATGTTNFSGGTALVGELGPELVNLPRGSDVIPNKDLSFGNNDGMNGKVVFEIQADKLVGILKREAKNRNYSR